MPDNSDERNIDSPLRSCADMAQHLDEIIDDRCPTIPTGIEPIDIILSGGIRDELMEIGGRPGVGKTDLAVNMTMGMARMRQVIFLTVELAANQIFLRMLACYSAKTDKSNAMTETRICVHADADRASIEALRTGFQSVGENLFIADDTVVDGVTDTAFTIEGLRGMIGRRREEGIETAVVIDYLQQIRCKKSDGTSGVDLLDYVSKQLATLAHAERTPVIALTSLSAQGDPRGSTHLLHAADIYLLLETDVAMQGRKVRPVTGHLRKNRNGVSGVDIELTYTPELHLFE